MKQRVLILSVGAGSGHKSAAAALEASFRESDEVAEVRNHDALELANPVFRELYAKLYLDVVRKQPQLYGWWYKESNEPWRTSEFRQILDRLNTDKLLRLLQDYRPDVTVCTHYMPAAILAQELAQLRSDTRLGIVTTDFEFHAMWLCQAFHRYFVALDVTRAHLEGLGLPRDRVTVSGIPIQPAFETRADLEDVRSRHGLPADRPVLLVSAGTFGLGPIHAILDQLRKVEADFHTVVVCGRNDTLREDVEENVGDAKDRFTVLGFTKEMHALMQAATLFLGKPGGLTTSEAMASGLPMVLANPIPGQEEHNADHLLEAGAAIRVNHPQVIPYKIGGLLNHPERVERMRAAARSLGRPEAAHVVRDAMLEERLPVHVVSREEKKEIAERAKG